MNKKRALSLARDWAQGHKCTLEPGEASEYHTMFATMLENEISNDPLTLEQLREMDGEPVYIPEIECWALVKREQTTLLFTFSDGKQCSASEWYEQVGPVYRSSLNAPQANEWISEEQLWEMNNVPIWVVDTSINRGEWCYWKNGLAYSCEVHPEYYDPDDYGHWLAYSRPPEGET